jgi:hypothetical protein
VKLADFVDFSDFGVSPADLGLNSTQPRWRTSEVEYGLGCFGFRHFSFMDCSMVGRAGFEPT